jgi:hypothetical protein
VEHRAEDQRTFRERAETDHDKKAMGGRRSSRRALPAQRAFFVDSSPSPVENVAAETARLGWNRGDAAREEVTWSFPGSSPSR